MATYEAAIGIDLAGNMIYHLEHSRSNTRRNSVFRFGEVIAAQSEARPLQRLGQFGTPGKRR